MADGVDLVMINDVRIARVESAGAHKTAHALI